MAKSKAKPAYESADGQHPTHHPLWTPFTEWAVENGVSREYKEDWNIWWECFLSGAQAAARGIAAAAVQHDVKD